MFNANNTYVMIEICQKYTFPIHFSLLIYSLSTKEKSSEDDSALKAFYYKSGSNGANSVSLYVQPFFCPVYYMTMEAIQTEDNYLFHKIRLAYMFSQKTSICT